MPSRGAKYEFHHDPEDWNNKARQLAREAPANCTGVCYARESRSGHELDFKTYEDLPQRSLWNGGNGIYYYRDSVGNTAWALYSRCIHVPLGVAMLGAQGQSLAAHHRPDELVDQQSIVRGYYMPIGGACGT